MIKTIAIHVIIATVAVFLIVIALSFLVKDDDKGKNRATIKQVEMPYIEEMFITPNDYSRPQLELEQVNAIVVHYTGNPGSTAKGNRDYFENLRIKKTTYASSHYVVGLEGEIIQCIPLTEISYASNNRNGDTIAIEVCHKDKSGKFNEDTYQSLVELVAWLCGKYNLDKDGIIRHYDVTGKKCPKYFVDHEDAWEQFKEDVFIYIEAEQSEIEPVK